VSLAIDAPGPLRRDARQRPNGTSALLVVGLPQIAGSVRHRCDGRKMVLPLSVMTVRKLSIALDDTIADEVARAAERAGVSVSAWLNHPPERTRD